MSNVSKMIMLTLEENDMKMLDLEQSKAGLIRDLLEKHFTAKRLTIEQLNALKELEIKAMEIYKDARISIR